MIPFPFRSFWFFSQVPTRPALWVFAVLVTVTACSREESHPGTVDNYYRISVEPPSGVKDPTFGWEIISKPALSGLRFFDLKLQAGGKEMTFQPDAPGDYRFEVTVFDSEGKAVTDRTYRFVIAEPVPEMEPVPAPVTPETTRVTDVEGMELPPDTAGADLAMAIDGDTQEVIQEESVTGDRIVAGPQETRKPAPPVRGSRIRRIEGKLTIQISSWPTLEQAQTQAEKLNGMGFDAYVQEAPFQESNETWYRVRVGSFTTNDAANQAAKDIQKATGLATWVDHVRVDY